MSIAADHATAIRVRAKVLRSLEAGELPELAPVRPVVLGTTIDDVLNGWFAARRTKVTTSTLQNYLSVMGRILSTLRTQHRIPDDKAIPGALLTRDAVIGLRNYLFEHEKLTEGTVYPTVRVLLAAWVWAADDPARYPGLTTPPRQVADVLPNAPVYGPTPAPTMDECDAVIRRLVASGTRIAVPVAVISRCTGLRVGQVLALRVGDVFLSEPSMTITAGKSRREKAERRTVPIAPALVPYLVPLVGRDPDEPLIRRRSDAGDGSTVRRGGSSRTMRTAWLAATVAGEVRNDVWNPPNRHHSRPDHAFRAAFQAHLVEAGSRFGAMRDAVALIPPIAWGEVEVLPSNVHRLR